MIQKKIPEIGAVVSVPDISGGTCAVSVKKIKHNFYAVTTVWTVTVPGKYHFSTEIIMPLAAPDLFIPAVLYRKNNCGSGAFVRGGVEDGLSFSEDRTPLPGCVILQSKNNYFGHCALPLKTTGFTASFGTCVKNGNAVISMEIPCVERPFSYEGKTRAVPEKEQKKELEITECSLQKPAVIERTQYLYTAENTADNKNDKNALFFFYKAFALAAQEQFSDSLKPEYISWSDWFSLKLNHLLFLTRTDSSDKGSCILMGKGNGENQEVYDFTGASFLVKSIEGALVFAESGKMQLSESIGRFFLQAESEKMPGVFRDNYSFKKNIWGGYLGVSENSEYAELVNARCNGEAMISYMQLYEALSSRGKKIPEFIELSERVVRFYIKNQFSNKKEMHYGSFGRWWTPDGKPVNAEGTNGAYIVSLMTFFYSYADKKLQKKIKKSLEAAASYYHTMIENADYYGDTLDADAYDKESAAVLMRESLDMFDFTGEKKYLDDAEKAASFVYTWMWQYNVLFPQNTPLFNEHFCTRGMTSVSVAHHHLDFYGMYLARDFLRLYKINSNKFYLNTACILLNACRQLVAKKGAMLGKSSDFEGWQPEQINYTTWDYFDRTDHMSGFYDICIAWVPVLTLGAYLQIKKECPEALALTEHQHQGM